MGDVASESAERTDSDGAPTERVLMNEGATPLLRRKAEAEGMSPRDYLRRLLEENTTITEAAKASGVHRSTIYDWCGALSLWPARRVR